MDFIRVTDRNTPRMRSLACIVVATALLAAACSSAQPGRALAPQEEACPNAGRPESPRDPALVERIEAMTLDEKIAQLMVAAFYGTSATRPTEEEARLNDALLGRPTLAALIEDHGLGGVVLVRRNIDGVDQVSELAAEIQAVARVSSRVGLLIAVDQEGGRANHLDFPPFVQFPSPQAFGRLADPELVLGASTVTGRQLRAVGVNTVFAPVVDVSHGVEGSPMADRVYGSDPNAVAALASAAVEGFLAAGVIPAAKHFPGLAATTVDSHDALPVIRIDRQVWGATDAIAFGAAVSAGVPVVVVGHSRVLALDPSGTPIPMSSDAIDGRLRRCLGFTGVAMTDALDMLAVGAMGSLGEVAVGAFAAGIDMLMIPPEVPTVIETVGDAVRTGALDESRIDTAVYRVLSLKAAHGLLVPPGLIHATNRDLENLVDPATVGAISTACDRLAKERGSDEACGNWSP